MVDFLEACIDEDDHSSGPEESEAHVGSNLGVSKFLNRSRSSLNVNDSLFLLLSTGKYCLLIRENYDLLF